MKEVKPNNKRRGFLKTALTIGASLGLVSLFGGKAKAIPVSDKEGDKIKMLTPDGRLVEINQTDIEKEVTSGRASDKEVMDWMNTKSKNEIL